MRNLALTLVSAALTLMLLVSPFLVGSTASVTYNPWADLNDDGDVDIFDVVLLAGHYSSIGIPVNKTELLYNVSDTLRRLPRIYTLSGYQREGTWPTGDGWHKLEGTWNLLLSISNITVPEGSNVVAYATASFKWNATVTTWISLYMDANLTRTESHWVCPPREYMAEQEALDTVTIHHTWTNLTGGNYEFRLWCEQPFILQFIANVEFTLIVGGIA